MAKENILSFYNYMENDPKVYKKMGKLENDDSLTPEKYSQKVSKIAHKAGFEFTSNELLDYLKEKKRYAEIQDEHLVAGGQAPRTDFSKGELAIAKVAKAAILSDATNKANSFFDDIYHGHD